MLAQRIIPELESKAEPPLDHDSSTNTLIRRYRKMKETAIMIRGYDQPLYILPFDHRGSFQTKMFGWHGDLTPEQTAEIAAAKQVIYDGFKAAVAGGVPKEKAGILVDEQFGAAILRDAAKHGFITACPAEKSGQDEFDFEYGDDFAQAHRGVPSDVLQGAGALQPRGRQGLESAAGGSAEAAFRLPASSRPTAGSCSSCWCRRKKRSSISSRATRRPTTWNCGRG